MAPVISEGFLHQLEDSVFFFSSTKGADDQSSRPFHLLWSLIHINLHAPVTAYVLISLSQKKLCAAFVITADPAAHSHASMGNCFWNVLLCSRLCQL